MAYSTKVQVKEVLQISEATWDTEIEACITDADARINNKLTPHESTLPLSPVPEMITIASKYIAAALYRERRDPTGDVKVFWDTGTAYLNEYIEAKYLGGAIQ